MGIIVGKYTLESLTTGMYANPRDIYREYIQNSVDSLDTAIKEELIHPNSAWINISIDNENRVIIFEDNGAGLPVETAFSVLTSIGNSNKSISSNRGFRGIGRLSGLSYCSKLTFETSHSGQPQKSIITFDAKKLKQLLIPGDYPDYDMAQVISEITKIEFGIETEKRHYFKVVLEGVDNIDGLLDFDSIVHFLSQTAPVPFNTNNFCWSRKIHKTQKRLLKKNEEFVIKLSNNDETVQLFKPYTDRFIADKFKRIADEISDIEIIEVKDDQENVLAFVWYSISQFFGSVLDERKKGLRFRKGNILVGDSTTLNSIFKENRFNGWFQGEVVIVSSKIIPNTRRDNFEKNDEYLKLVNELERIGSDLSKKIRNASAARSNKFPVPKQKNTGNEASALKTEIVDPDDSEEIAIDASSINFESDTSLQLFKSLRTLIKSENQITKYHVLNTRNHLTIDQKKTLEKVFDAISENCDKEQSVLQFNAILNKFNK